MARKLTIGGESEFHLLPEAPRVKVYLKSAEPSQYNASVERWCFQIEDPEYANGDSEDVDTAIQEASDEGIELFESVNLPKGPKIGKRTKLYQFLAGMNGADIEEDAEVDLDDFIPGHYLADIEVVDKMVRLDDGSFRPGKDENGRPLKKNAVTKLRPVAKRKSARTTAPKPKRQAEPDIPDDDSDLDDEEDEVE